LQAQGATAAARKYSATTYIIVLGINEKHFIRVLFDRFFTIEIHL